MGWFWDQISLYYAYLDCKDINFQTISEDFYVSHYFSNDAFIWS